MAIIRDIMPAFELFQPATIGDALALARSARQRRLGYGGRTRYFDWLKDRIKRPKVVVDLSQVRSCEA